MKAQFPLILVLSVVAVGLLRIVQYYWRELAA